MHEENLIKHGTTQPPIVIRSRGLSVEAKELFDAIAKRAHEIFESKGRVRGHDLDNWLQAETELFGQTLVSVKDSPESLTVLADMRNFTPKELEIDLQPERVTIIAKHQNQKELRTATDIRKEESSSRLVRSLQLPVKIDARHASARLNNGILELDLKKATAAKVKRAQASGHAD